MKICNFRNKIVISVILGVLILGCYVMMFLFSADNAGDSSAISSKITTVIMEIYDYFFGTDAVTQSAPSEGIGMADILEKVVRKIAHFTEFFLLGSLSYGLVYLWIESRKKCVLILFIQLLLSAGFDELHQSFVPGRYASVSDVMLDTLGGMTGVFILYLFLNRKRKIIKNEQ